LRQRPGSHRRVVWPGKIGNDEKDFHCWLRHYSLAFDNSSAPVSHQLA
jgi:hypothetical protein